MSSKRRLRKKACEGKRRMSVEEAYELAKQYPDGIHPYSCPHCGYWHIGHKRRRDLSRLAL